MSNAAVVMIFNDIFKLLEPFYLFYYTEPQ